MSTLNFVLTERKQRPKIIIPNSTNQSRISGSFALLYKKRRRMCGAVLISNQHALTDSSCTENLDVTKLDIRFENIFYSILRINPFTEIIFPLSIAIVSSSL